MNRQPKGPGRWPPVTVRIDPDHLEEADRLASSFRQLDGRNWDRADIFREAFARGLSVLHVELLRAAPKGLLTEPITQPVVSVPKKARP